MADEDPNFINMDQFNQQEHQIKIKQEHLKSSQYDIQSEHLKNAYEIKKEQYKPEYEPKMPASALYPNLYQSIFSRGLPDLVAQTQPQDLHDHQRESPGQLDLSAKSVEDNEENSPSVSTRATDLQ